MEGNREEETKYICYIFIFFYDRCLYGDAYISMDVCLYICICVLCVCVWTYLYMYRNIYTYICMHVLKEREVRLLC